MKQRTGKFANTECRWRECNAESGPKDQIQYGGVTDATYTSYSDRAITNRRFTLTMDFAEEMKKMQEEEEVLLRRIERRIKWQTVLRKQKERLNMLRNLAGNEKCEVPPSKREIERLVEREQRRDEQASKTLFLSLQAKNLERSFYQQAKVIDNDGGTECDVEVIVSVKNVKKNKDMINPININLIVNDNSMDGNVQFTEQKNNSDIPKSLDKVIEYFMPKSTSTKKDDKKDEQRKVKPRVTSDVRVSLPRIKINKEQKQRVAKSSESYAKAKTSATESDKEIARLKELLNKAQRKRYSASSKTNENDSNTSDNIDSDSNNGVSKELPRSKKSRRSSLAGVMKPEASTNLLTLDPREEPEMEATQCSQRAESVAKAAEVEPTQPAEESLPTLAEEGVAAESPATRKDVPRR
ncbi:unnamed protein product [Lasius platythorax]|uniref:Uncharacterized protein n=1 Tax=Lasius platythorax TaxID=488582 RepID=A0AAV2MXX6_9HYME